MNKAKPKYKPGSFSVKFTPLTKECCMCNKRAERQVDIEFTDEMLGYKTHLLCDRTKCYNLLILLNYT